MYDLLILALNEKTQSNLLLNRICIKALNRNGGKKQKYYYEIWPFINNAYGILYKVFTKDGLGQFECCDEMFRFGAVDDIKPIFPQVLFDLTERETEDCVSMVLDERFAEEFVCAVDRLLSCSPISTIAFLCRGQSFDAEIVIGTMSFNDFVKKLCKGHIYTNVCYLIVRDSTHCEQ